MSKKNLLNESQVRQFMKLAKLEPLTPGFVEGLSETHGRGPYPPDVKGGDNTSPGRRRRNEGEDPFGDEPELADAEDDMEPADDLEVDAEEDLGDVDMDPADDRTVDVDDFLSALETALEDVLGDEVEIDSDEMEDEPEPEPEAEDEFAPEGDEVVAARILKSALAKK